MRVAHRRAPVGARWRRSGGLVAAAVLVGLGLTACGGADDATRSGPSTSSEAGSDAAADGGYPFDTSTTGDDLLQADRVEHGFGPDVPVTWRFPLSYADGTTDETSSSVEAGEARYGLQVVAGAEGTPRSKAEELVTRLGGQTASIQDVRLEGRDWVAVVDDGEPVRRVVLLGSLPDGVVAGAIFTADVPLTEVPEERVAELHQTVLSIRPRA